MNKKLQNKAFDILKDEGLNLNYEDSDFIYSFAILSENLEEYEKKQYLKNFKKSIENLINNFDEDYLLLKINRIFSISENLLFLELFDKINLILEENNYEKLSEKLTDIKLRIDLGFQRYFLHNKKVIVTEFDEDFNFNLIADKEIKNEINNEILLSYSLIKKSKKFLPKNEILELFPQYIYKKNEIKLDILKSLYFKDELNLLELKKEKVILKNTNNIRIACLTILILENLK